MEEEIFTLAKVLGQVAEAEKERLRRLCAGAAAELEGRLRPGVKAEDCGTAFPLAAAWLALAGLAAAAASGGVKRFTAGDVTIQEQEGGGTERAALLRQQADAVLAPYLRDSGFFFRGV